MKVFGRARLYERTLLFVVSAIVFLKREREGPNFSGTIVQEYDTRISF